ncbi:MAG: hypothetical protein JXP36_19025 [Bacteroidales bacterium]|nr:hypothetical protein [Bacteroidales bacterium]
MKTEIYIKRKTRQYIIAVRLSMILTTYFIKRLAEEFQNRLKNGNPTYKEMEDKIESVGGEINPGRLIFTEDFMSDFILAERESLQATKKTPFLKPESIDRFFSTPEMELLFSPLFEGNKHGYYPGLLLDFLDYMNNEISKQALEYEFAKYFLMENVNGWMKFRKNIGSILRVLDTLEPLTKI